jgi:hypothetical protein
MLPGEIKGDAAFTAFQAKLATCAANATKIGRRITSGPGHSTAETARCCPLGAHPDVQEFLFPSSPAAHAGPWREVPQRFLRAFINGFGGDGEKLEPADLPYAQLGVAYREAFP